MRSLRIFSGLLKNSVPQPEPVPRFAGACAIQVKQFAASPPSRLQRWPAPVRRLATTIIVGGALLSVLLGIGTNL